MTFFKGNLIRLINISKFNGVTMYGVGLDDAHNGFRGKCLGFKVRKEKCLISSSK